MIVQQHRIDSFDCGKMFLPRVFQTCHSLSTFLGGSNELLPRDINFCVMHCPICPVWNSPLIAMHRPIGLFRVNLWYKYHISFTSEVSLQYSCMTGTHTSSLLHIESFKNKISHISTTSGVHIKSFCLSTFSFSKENDDAASLFPFIHKRYLSC